MFFSVIIPIYNVEMYLKECIDSILSQSFEDFELILVDDGSKDSSGVICDEYAKKDTRIKVIHKENGGLSDARNCGTQASVGNYIVYLDSDDYICDKDFLAKLYEKANQGTDVICYKFKKYYEDKNIFSECAYSCPNIENYKKLADKVKYMVSCDAFYCSAWSKAVKASILKENGISFEKGLLGEDQEWYYHVLYNITSIDFIDEVFVIYRQRPCSITSSWKIKNLTDCIYVVNKWYTKLQNSELETEYKNALLNSVAKLYCNLLIGYTRFNDPQKKEYFSELKKMSGLLNFHANPRVNVFYKIYRVGGFRTLMSCLKIICKVR